MFRLLWRGLLNRLSLRAQAGALMFADDFEAPWAGSHLCHVFPKDAEPYQAQVGNIFTPSGGWVFWFRHTPGDFDQPEGRDAHKVHDSRRVRSGEKAFMFFSFWRRHDAGLYQRVQVIPNTPLRLTAYMHSWSSDDDNPYTSEGVGEGIHFIPESEIPSLNGNHTNDAIGNALFSVGIDPAGGTDPFADTVTWGDAAAIYNGYSEPLMVEAVAEADTVTVFLRNRLLWRFKHGDAYIEDVTLEVIEGPEPPSPPPPPPPPSPPDDGYGLRYSPETPVLGDQITIEVLSGSPFAHIPVVTLALDCEYVGTIVRGGVYEASYLTTPAIYSGHHDILVDGVWLGGFYVPGDAPPPPPVIPPPPQSGRGQPRVQYERLYALLAPDMGAEWAKTVIEALWDDFRVTIGGSADDSGLGDLDVRRILAINPQDWPGALSLEDFFDLYYPSVEYTPIQADNLYQLRGRLVAFGLKMRDVSLGYPTTHRPPFVTDVFGRDRGSYFHNGLDLRSSWSQWEDEVLSATDGEVIVAGWNRDEPWFGYQVRVKGHSGAVPLLVRYAHLTQDGVYPQVGQRVSVGDKIGRPDNTGTSTGDHLHFDVKVGGQYADPEMLIRWPEDGPNGGNGAAPLQVGLHDAPGIAWMVAHRITGVALAHVAVQREAVPLDFTAYQRAGIDTYLRVNWGYADGTGTLPPPEHLAAWISAVAETIRGAHGLAGVHIGNEANNPAEWCGGYPNPTYILTPRYYVNAYNAICTLLADCPVPLAPFPLDPFNVVAGQFGVEADPREWARYVYANAARVDWISLHAKTQGAEPTQCWSREKFADAPLVGRYLHLRTLEDQLSWISAQHRGKPALVCELNPQRRRDGTLGWDGDGAKWVREALAYVATLPEICGAMFYRFGAADPWGLETRPDILEAISKGAASLHPNGG